MEIPKEVQSVLEKLQKSGFEAYIVGGCVRDLLLGPPIGGEPQDWDITTNATPEKMTAIFPKSFCENKFGTVTVLTSSKKENLKEIEITPYRTEAGYSDKRHPDVVNWAKTIEEDLSRRDFTVNAMAIGTKPQIPSPKSQAPNPKPQILKNKNWALDIGHWDFKVIDPFGGQKDLENKIIRAVGNPGERFFEDALRMMRAVRFATVFNFRIEENTIKAIKENSESIKDISQERIRDEFVKIIMSENAEKGVELLRELFLLKYILPELLESYKVGQNKHHIYDCWEHSVKSLDFAAKKGFNKYVRLAALFHDIGKPRSKRGDGTDSTFYSHEIIGAKMTRQILERLKFPKAENEKITKLVRYHLFYYNAGEVTESSVRRLVKNAGIGNMDELLQVRMADRIGSGVPKAEPYKLRHLKYIIEKVSRDPISAKMLKINGNDIMKNLEIKAGPKIGQILEILLDQVLADPAKNKKEILREEAEKLGKLSEKELKSLAENSKKEVEAIETKEDQMTKKKYWVS